MAVPSGPPRIIKGPVRMMFLLTVLAVTLSASGAPRREQRVSKRRVACKTAEIAASCYWTHGRLSFYNGNPSYRLWKIGTRRILGIYSSPSGNSHDYRKSDVNPELPVNVQRAFKSLDTQLFGDYEVCPLKPERPGVMQPACIESAKNLVAVEP